MDPASSPSREDMEEIECCEFYEYAREAPTLRDLNQNWEEISQEIPSAFHGCYFPLLNTASLPFPETPWLALSREHREGFRKSFVRQGVIALPSFGIAADQVEAISAWAPERRRDYVFFCIDPSSWKNFTDRELGELMAASIARWRPRNIREPGHSGIGRSFTDALARLRWLAATRLYSRYPFLELRQFVDALGVRASWVKEGNLLQKPWIRDRQRARDRFHELFPFLPPGEEPLSHPTYFQRKNR